MAFYFFGDISNLNIQSSGGYGPAANTVVNSVEYEQFLVTSKHSATADVDAIAVCKGQILVQEQSSNSDLLNIVLKPMDTQPFGFPKIKYYIYKGIRKDTLIAENNIELAPENTNDLVKSIWTSFKKRNASGIPAKSILGLQSDLNSLPDSTQLDEVFATVYTDVQFWNIQAGDTLGKFDKNSIGFEIILDALFYKPTLELTRSSETYVRVKSLITSPLQKDFFEHWHDKETILSFIDPCAFWGSFYNEKLSVVVSSVMQRWQGTDVYTNVLSKFVNKNKAYIDIRNEFNYSINYFKNYGASATVNTTNIKIIKGTATQETIDYYQTGWPLLILDNSGFNSSNDDYQTISLQLPAGNGDNPSPLIYFSKAHNISESFPEEYQKEEKFVSLEVNSNYTDSFSLAIPWTVGNNISSYSLIKYNKRFSDDVLPSVNITQIRRNDYMDAIFPVALDFEYETSVIKTKVYDEEIYVDARIVHNCDAVFNLSLSFETDNLTLLANPSFFNYRDSQRRPLELVSDFEKFGSSLKKIIDISNKAQGAIPMKKILTLNDIDFEVLDIEKSYTDRQELVNVPDLQKLITLTLTKEQWDDVVDLSQSTFLQKYAVYIRCLDKLHLEDDNQISYSTFQIGLSGFIDNGTSIQTSTISTQITLTAYGIL